MCSLLAAANEGMDFEWSDECKTAGKLVVKSCLEKYCLAEQMTVIRFDTDNTPVSQWINFNTLRLRQNGCHFTDDILKRIFLNENI